MAAKYRAKGLVYRRILVTHHFYLFNNCFVFNRFEPFSSAIVSRFIIITVDTELGGMPNFSAISLLSHTISFYRGGKKKRFSVTVKTFIFDTPTLDFRRTRDKE